MEQIYLSSNLKYLRNKGNKTQDDIAKIIEKGASAVGNYENGLREPTAVDLGKLANYFGVSVDDLVFKDLRFEENSINPEDIIIMPVNTNKFKKGDEVTAQQLVDYISELQNKLDKIKESL